MEVNKNEKMVQGTIPGTVTAGPTLRPVSPPLPRARESAARSPASRDTLHFETRYAGYQWVTPGLEWADPQHVANSIPGGTRSLSSFPCSGYRQSLHQPDARVP